MSRLRLRVNLFPDVPTGDTHVLANVYPADEATRGSGRGVRDQLIPAGDQYDRYATIDLTPGRYVVEVDLPSGRNISSDVEITQDEPEPLELEPGPSPHEWMSWQHLVGNVGDGQRFQYACRNLGDGIALDQELDLQVVVAAQRGEAAQALFALRLQSLQP